MRISALLISLAVLLSLPMQAWCDTTDLKTNRKFDYFYYEGLRLKQAGRYDAAFDLFNHCFALDSTSAPLLFELSAFHLRQQRLDKAVDMLKRAGKYASGNITYKKALAMMLYEAEMYSEAIDVYRELVDNDPGNSELIYLLADVLTRSGQTAAAIETYDRLESVMGVNEGIAIQKFRLYHLQEKSDSALIEIEKLAGKFPMEPRYPIMIGDLYLEKGNTAKADEFYRKAYSLDPTNPYYIVSMANYYEAVGESEAAEAQIRDALASEALAVDVKINILSRYLIRLERQQSESDKGNELFEMLINMHPEEIDLRIMYARMLAMKEQTEEAKFHFRLVSEMAPERDDAWQSLLDIAFREGNRADALKICEKCIELFPDAPEYYFYLSIARFQNEDFGGALEACRKGAERVPDDNKPLKSNFYGQIGDIFHEMGNDAEAFAAYEMALTFNERNISVLNNYAYFLSLRKKDLRKAERMSAQCIKMEPDNSTYLDTYAWIFFMQGNYTLAKFYIESAISKDTTDSVELIDHYGDILFMIGDKAGALAQWRKAKELGKEGENLDEKIAREEYIEDDSASK
ncbi:MAG: tetratricopeptide repeat protein [Tannerellaceae bacterium]|jgi:tetratricopeptide (TPR) repeat protein|nr:tetratricopeptide repeat protein [Tannerellaceae bacterium]